MKKKKEFIMAQETKKQFVMSEEQRLLSRWTMELAAYLQEEHDMERKAAMELAHLNRELITHLGSGRVWFEYLKEDGTEREACGTLCKGVSEQFDEYVCKGSRKKADQWPTEVFTYWDLDKQAFRTWQASRLLKIKAVTTVNCQHEMIYF
jgi:hypothetical protein